MDMRAPVEFADITADVLARIRSRAPRVHCITNSVAQAYTANMLLAAGAIPSMTISPEEIAAFVAGADALLVNLGTFDAERRAAIDVALGALGQGDKAGSGKPWVLDPVFIERSPARAQFAQSLVSRKPAAVRLNHREFAALAGGDAAGDAPARFAKRHDTVVALTGNTDVVTDGATFGKSRQRRSADGAGHRHGLRRLGAGRRRFGGGARSLARHHRRAGRAWRRRRGGGGEYERAGALRQLDHRRAPRPRQRDVARAHQGVDAMQAVDLRLNAIVDPERSGGHDLADLARLCAQGGATLIQLRDKRERNPRHGRRPRARSNRRWRRSTCRWSSTTASTWRSPPAPTACMSVRTTWRSRMRDNSSAATPSSGCRSRPWRRRRPRRSN